jgi:hypothetical protein
MASRLGFTDGYRCCLRWLWPSPWTAFGLLIACLGLPGRGKIERYQGALIAYGRFIAWLLERVPIMGGAAALTLGHCILARTREDAVGTFEHEWVHVRQYERWGPFFVPAYFGCSVWLWMRSCDPYLKNPFEIEAYTSTRTRLRT